MHTQTRLYIFYLPQDGVLKVVLKKTTPSQPEARRIPVGQQRNEKKEAQEEA